MKAHGPLPSPCEFILRLNFDHLADPWEGHLRQICLDGKEGLGRKVLGCGVPTVKATGVRPHCERLWMVRRHPGDAGPQGNESGGLAAFDGPDSHKLASSAIWLPVFSL